jgi:glycosyltransferase involved in cell wall biosynthesis
MPRPRLLFLTDDRHSYAEGNYYLAYQRAFLRHADVTLHHPLDALPGLARFDLVVLGHAAIEHFARLRGARLLPRALHQRLARVWARHASLRVLRRTRVPIALFTKNDYKFLEIKSSFIRFVQPRLVITHTRSALAALGQPERGRTIWLPFGVDLAQFSPPAAGAERPYAVGFRANANSEWNDGERERFYRALRRIEHERPVSLTLSKHGEGFLVGQPYVDWIRSCSLLGNTVSAAGTVGPRFLEAMACGTVPLAPRNRYEDLLVADTHYVPADTGDGSFPALESAVTRFFDDPAYREQLRGAGRALVEAHAVDRHVIQVCREAGV